MLWFLTLHIITLLFWAAALLYLPALIFGSRNHGIELNQSLHYGSVARFVFTQVASPAAVAAIIMGTIVFVLDNNTTPWLIAKLTLVALLVGAHAFTGILVLRLEKESEKPVLPWCAFLLVVLGTLMTAVIWLVLAKPAWEV